MYLRIKLGFGICERERERELGERDTEMSSFFGSPDLFCLPLFCCPFPCVDFFFSFFLTSFYFLTNKKIFIFFKFKKIHYFLYNNLIIEEVVIFFNTI